MLQTSVIYCGDNLYVLPSVEDASVDLIYIDPPFNTGRQYEVFWGEAQERRSFLDRYGAAMSYIEWMRPRIRELHRVLKPTGSFYYHCDPTAAHYVKVELDRVFGADNFRAEVVWRRTSAHGNAKRNYAAIHDTILFYTKGKAWTWNPQFEPYSEEYIATHFVHQDPDGRQFRRVDLRNPSFRPNLIYDYKGYKPHPNGWAVSREKMEELDRAGRLFFPAKGTSGRIRRKLYLDESPGVPISDVWTDIKPIFATGLERIGYPTQKPLPLLDRIILTSSSEQQVVLDAFCGCGTTIEAAARHQRRWIGIDSSPTACRVISGRLRQRLALYEGDDFELHGMPRSTAELRRMPHFEFQNWAVIALGGIPNQVKSADYGIDGRLYVADMPKEREIGTDLFGDIDNWFPIQVKQTDRSGRPDIDSFETAMRRDKRRRGYFIAFGFSADARREIQRANKEDGLDIVPITVAELLAQELMVSPRLPAPRRAEPKVPSGQLMLPNPVDEDHPRFPRSSESAVDDAPQNAPQKTRPVRRRRPA